MRYCNTGTPLNLRRRRLLLTSLLGLAIAPAPAWATSVKSRPLRVVALDYNLIEMLLSLDMVPVGAADLKGYQRWVGLGWDKLRHTIPVGSRQQPSLEILATLRPDLIVGVDFRHLSLLPVLQKIAPTFLMTTQQQGDGLTIIRRNFLQLASRVDRTAKAQQVLVQLDNTLASARAQLTHFASHRLGVLQGLAATPSCWAFAVNSLPGGVVGALGMVNAWPDDNAAQGIITVGVEDLLNETADLAAIVNPKADFTRGTLWSHVPAIAQKRLARLPADVATFGGPESAERLAMRLTQSLLLI